MKITFCGGAEEVTGANFLFETSDSKFLIDCGLAQGGDFAEKKNYENFSYDPKTIDFLIVTHAHLDHIGRIPKLVKDGFKGKIISTFATKNIAEVMFVDAVHILEMHAREHNHEALYSLENAQDAIALWETAEYGQEFDLGTTLKAHLLNAGHILGSAMVKIKSVKNVFLATGDLGNSPNVIIKNPEIVSDANYILMESVYGDRNHIDRGNRKERLAEFISEAVKDKHTLIIPSFALDRTQSLLYEIKNIFANKEAPSVPVFLDSPLATKITDIYRDSTKYFNEKTKNESERDDIFSFPDLHVSKNKEDSEKIEHAPNPKIIISASGMSAGGRVLRHEKDFLSKRDATILFIGYQGVGTLGRKIQDGARSVLIEKEWIRVRARARILSGYSGHMDRDSLVDFVSHSAESGVLKKVFVSMGEIRSSLFLAQRLNEFFGANAVVPRAGEAFEVEM